MSAYIIARITVTNPLDYQSYASQTVATAEKFGGRFLVKGGAQQVLEGNCPDRHLIIEFPLALNSSERDIVLVDGI